MDAAGCATFISTQVSSCGPILGGKCVRRDLLLNVLSNQVSHEPTCDWAPGGKKADAARNHYCRSELGKKGRVATTCLFNSWERRRLPKTIRILHCLSQTRQLNMCAETLASPHISVNPARQGASFKSGPFIQANERLSLFDQSISLMKKKTIN